jgi:hypothetical protein
MTSASTTYTPEFFKNLSCLFYSISASDKNIAGKEKRKIIDLVERYWTSNKDDFDSKAYIYSELKRLIESRFNSEVAFDNFKSYFQKNQSMFSFELRKKIMDSAYEIANAFAKRNKSELLLLSKLHLLLFEK